MAVASSTKSDKWVSENSIKGHTKCVAQYVENLKTKIFYSLTGNMCSTIEGAGNPVGNKHLASEPRIAFEIFGVCGSTHPPV